MLFKTYTPIYQYNYQKNFIFISVAVSLRERELSVFETIHEKFYSIKPNELRKMNLKKNRKYLLFFLNILN